MHKKLCIVYELNKPHGIRDEHGYLFFFTKIQKWPGQDDRYRREVEKQFKLADFLLSSLQGRAKEQGEAVQTSTQQTIPGSQKLTQICPECSNDHRILQHHGKAWQCGLCGAKWGQTYAIANRQRKYCLTFDWSPALKNENVMDYFKRSEMKEIGPGGLNCPCCGPKPGPDRRALKRRARARIKSDDRKNEALFAPEEK